MLDLLGDDKPEKLTGIQVRCKNSQGVNEKIRTKQNFKCKCSVENLEEITWIVKSFDLKIRTKQNFYCICSG